MALVLVAAACGDDGDGEAGPSAAENGGDTPGADDRIVIALAAEPEDLNPYQQVQNPPDSQVYQSLTRFDATGETVPELAAELPTEIDDTTWEVTVREGVTYHDGTPLTAQTVADSLNLLFSDTFPGAEEALELGPVYDSAEAVDETTLRIDLTDPQPLLPSLLAAIHIVQPDNLDPNNPVGTGAYQFVEWNRGDSIILEQFPDYWGDAPDVEELEYRIIPESSTQVAAFRAGEVDLIFNLPIEDIEQISDENVEEAAEGGETGRITLNNLTGITSDVRVRRALNLAVNREAIRDNLFSGRAEIIPGHPFTDDYVGFNPDLEAYPYDPDQARELITEAGAEGAKIEILASDGLYPKDREVAQAVAAMWSEVGLNATARVIGVVEDFFDAILEQSSAEARPTAFQTFSGSSVLDGSDEAPYFAPPLTPDSAVSSMLPEVAERFSEIAALTDIVERDDAWQEFYADAREQAYFVYLVTPAVLWVHSDKIENVNPMPTAEPSFSRMADIELAS